MSIRSEKVAAEIQKALARPLRDIALEISAGLITATHVRMSPDLRIAKVYVSIFGGRTDSKQAMIVLETRAKDIRRAVVAQVRLRFAPELRFYLDDTLEVMDRVSALLNKVPDYASNPDSPDSNVSASPDALRQDDGTVHLRPAQRRSRRNNNGA